METDVETKVYLDLERQIEVKLEELKYRVHSLIDRGYTDLRISIQIDPETY